MDHIKDELGRVLGNRNPVRVEIVGGTAPGDGGTTPEPSPYPADVVLINDTAATGTLSGSYTSTDNVTATLRLSDTSTSSGAVFTAYLQYKSTQRLQISGFTVSGTVDEVQTAPANTIIQYAVPAGYTLIVEVTGTPRGTVSVKGTVSP